MTTVITGPRMDIRIGQIHAEQKRNLALKAAKESLAALERAWEQREHLSTGDLKLVADLFEKAGEKFWGEYCVRTEAEEGARDAEYAAKWGGA